MSRGWRTAAVLGAVQLVLLAVWWAVDRRRSAPAPEFRVESIDQPAPPLAVVRDAAPVPLPAEPHVVHFWATWCGPCQAELPALLAACTEAGMPVLAVTEEEWSSVERWFDGPVPPAVVRDATGAAVADWEVTGLPDTFVVVGGRVIARMGGPRPWAGAEAKAQLAAWSH